MTNRTAWTPAENAALVRLYFRMLDRATTGRQYNKAAMIRDAQTDSRSTATASPACSPAAAAAASRPS